MDQILIEGLSARCIIGVGAEERRAKQEVLVDLAIEADLSRAARSDRFEDAVDYRAIKKRVLSLTEASQFHLLEALAESIASACLEYAGVRRTKVTVHKPGALRFSRSVAIEISRPRA